MRVSALLFVLLFCGFFAQSQDLIVKQSGDSLNCKVIKNESDFVYFKLIKNHRLTNDSLPVGEVKKFVLDYYRSNQLVAKQPASSVEETNQAKPVEQAAPNYVHPIVVKEPEQKKLYRATSRSELGNFYMAANAGFSFRTEKVPKDVYNKVIEDYLNSINSGGSWGVEAGYFFNDNIGVGLTYSHHFSQGVLDNVYLEDTITGQVYEGDYSINVAIDYVGASVLFRYMLGNEKSIFFGKMSLGTTMYKRKEKIIVIDYVEEGVGAGMLLTGGYLHRIDRNLIAGLTLNYNYSLLDRVDVTINDIKYTFYGAGLDLSRIDVMLTIGAFF